MSLSKPVEEEIITITFSRCVENHAGNVKHGQASLKGISCAQLEEMAKKLKSKVIDLKKEGELQEHKEVKEASLLVFPNFLEQVGCSQQELLAELKALTWDKHMWSVRQKKVQQKHARHNLCFGPEHISAVYEQGQGTVYSFEEVSRLAKVRKILGQLFGPEFTDLLAEGNYYFSGLYDFKKGAYERHRVKGRRKTGIGFHGKERVIDV